MWCGETKSTAALRRSLRRFAALSRFAPGQGPSEGLRILTYHRVNGEHPGDRLSIHPEEFSRQMEELARSSRPVVSIERVSAALRDEAPWPHGGVALTFDDGFRDNYTCALPILENFGFPACFFIATGFVGNTARFPRYRDCCDEDDFMDWEQIGELARRGHTLGGHGRHHQELAPLDPGGAEGEVKGCREDIEARAGLPVRFFCYPRGSESPAVRRLVAACGYEAACTVRPGGNVAGTDLYGLRRTEISADDGLREFRLKLQGAFDGWHRFVQRMNL